MISKERLLKGKQTPTRLSDPPKKPITKDKTKPLGSQRVGPESEQLGVTWFRHLVIRFGTRKCWSQHVLLHLKEYGDNLAINE
jgi:hypothetical protein